MRVSPGHSSPISSAYCSGEPVLGATTRWYPRSFVSIAAPMQASPPRALVVDDDAALRMLSRVNLELDGFQVDEASTVDETEAAVRAHRPDVVLLDVHLGGQETHSLLARLRADGIPVALVTGAADASRFRETADEVLMKPFSPQRLVEIARVLARVEA